MDAEPDPVDSEGWWRRGHGARRFRSDEDPRADHVHDGPCPATGPRLRADFQALSRESRTVRTRVREGLVQTDAPRHGTAFSQPRPVGLRRTTALARPRARSDARANQC